MLMSNETEGSTLHRLVSNGMQLLGLEIFVIRLSKF